MPAHRDPVPRAVGKTLEAWLRGRMAPARAPVACAVAAGALGGLCLVAQAWLLARIIDAVALRGLGLDGVRPWLLELLAVFAARAVLSVAADALAFEAGARVALEVRAAVIDRLAALGPAFARSSRTGEIATVAVDGVEGLRKYYEGYLPQMALAGAVPLAILLFVAAQDWVSGLIMALSAPLIPLFMVLIGKGTEALNRRQWRQLARLGAQFFDAIEGLTTLKLFGASRREVEVVAASAEDYRLRTMAVLRVAFLSALTLEFFATVSIAMIAVYVGFRLYAGDLGFVPGLFALLLAPEFFRPLRGMGTQYHARMEAIGAAEAVVELLRAEPPAARAATAALAAGAPSRVAFERVRFAYGPEGDVLHDVGFTLARGERVALVGPSGAGKSTIGELLLGLADPGSGRVAVDGVDLRDLPRADWLARVAWLPQRPTLFHGTLRDNLLLARPDAGPDALRAALEAADADGFVDALPDGLDTPVGDRGQGLSGGEVRRIALARVFLSDAAVVVLDEPTAALDPGAAGRVTRAIERLAQNRAVLVIAHRLETLRGVDRILVLDAGRIVEAGRPEALLARDSRFAGLVGILEGSGRGALEGAREGALADTAA